MDAKYKPAYDPVNEDLPTAADLSADKDLELFMNRNIVIETDTEMERRNEILETLNKIFVKWVREVGRDKMNILEEDSQDDAGGLIFISGSHRLNVREPNADIDTICVAPAYCTRDDFFSSLKKVLLDHPDVAELNAVSTAFVPLIELEFRGIAIDLLFARLAENVVRANLDVLDDNILQNVDSATEKTLNGPRVTDMISKLVPNYENFLIVLRCVRKWAKARGLYGNKFGYLGGVNYNILVAFIGQLYPKSSPSALLARFFRVYSRWQWPTPIMLNQIRPNGPGENRQVWNAQTSPGDLMPLITPAFPAMNSSHNVNRHSLKVMSLELQRAHTIMQNIMTTIHSRPNGSSVSDDEIDANWMKLFEPSDFFIKYHHYLRCNLVGGSDPAATAQWQSFVESKIRFLVMSMDSLPIDLPVHLFPVKSKTGNNSICYFVGFNADKSRLRGDQNDIYLDKAIGLFRRNLQNYSGPRGEDGDDLHFTYEYYKWRHLPKECFDTIGGKAIAKIKRLEIYPKPEKEKTEEEAAETTTTVKEEGNDGDTNGDVTIKEEDDDDVNGTNKKRKLDDLSVGGGGVGVDEEGIAAAAAADAREEEETLKATQAARRRSEAALVSQRPLQSLYPEQAMAWKTKMQTVRPLMNVKEVKWNLI